MSCWLPEGASVEVGRTPFSPAEALIVTLESGESVAASIGKGLAIEWLVVCARCWELALVPPEVREARDLMQEHLDATDNERAEDVREADPRAHILARAGKAGR